MQQARKWLFRPKFFSVSKWAQFLHVTLDLTGKRCPVIFSAVLFFVFEKFSSTSTGGKCALRWFYCLEKQKLSLERTPPGKKLRFCICYLWKMKEKPANLNGGLCFSIKWKATCRNWAHLDEEKNFGLKSHLRACCMQPFNYYYDWYKMPLRNSWYPEKNLSEQGENKQQTQPTYDAGSGNWTRATLVGGKRSHYYAGHSCSSLLPCTPKAPNMWLLVMNQNIDCVQ